MRRVSRGVQFRGRGESQGACGFPRAKRQEGDREHADRFPMQQGTRRHAAPRERWAVEKVAGRARPLLRYRRPGDGEHDRPAGAPRKRHPGFPRDAGFVALDGALRRVRNVLPRAYGRRVPHHHVREAPPQRDVRRAARREVRSGEDPRLRVVPYLHEARGARQTRQFEKDTKAQGLPESRGLRHRAEHHALGA